MPQAKITINAVIGSSLDLVAGAVVALNNVNIGGEVTYAWTLLDKPVGSAAVLTNPVIVNPAFTADCEGSYRLQLVVNAGLATEDTDIVIAAVLQVKSRRRVPAALEETEADASDGWAVAVDQLLRDIDNLMADSGKCIGVAHTAMNYGNVVRVSGVSVIKTGLPGVETLPLLDVSHANVLAELDGQLGIVVTDNTGNVAVGLGHLAYVRLSGRIGPFAGAAVLRAPVYVNNAGMVSLTAGATPRRIGRVCAVDAVAVTYDVWVDGANAAADATNPYLLNGAATTALPNSVDVTEMTAFLRLQVRDAANAAVKRVLTVSHALNAGLHGAANHAVGVSFEATDDTAATPTEIALLMAVLDNPAAATPHSSFVLKGLFGATGLQEYAKVSEDGIKVESWDSVNNAVQWNTNLEHHGVFVGASGIGSGIHMTALDGTGTLDWGAGIAGVLTDPTTGAVKSALDFYTSHLGTFSAKMRLDDNGVLCVNCTTPVGTEKFCVSGGAYVDGSVGIGVAPLARLHLAAGTAAALSAPQKFEIGVIMAAPEAGAFEYDGTSLLYTDRIPARKPLRNWRMTTKSFAVHTVLGAWEFAECDCAGGTYVLNIPSAVVVGPGVEVAILKTSADVSAITVTPVAGDIDGAVTKDITAQWTCMTLVSNGANWRIT